MGDFISASDMESMYDQLDLIRLSNNDGSGASTINTTVIDTFIGEAESVIKSFIQARYSLPFTVIPQAIKNLALRMTNYYLNSRKGSITDQIQVIYENDRAYLKSIRRGDADIDTLPGENSFQEAEVINSYPSAENERDPIDLEGF